LEEGSDVFLVGAPDVGTEADPLASGAALDDLLDAGERATTDEQDVGGVDLDDILVGLLPPALVGYRGSRALEDLEQGPLHAFTRYVASDRGVLALPRDL